jgi:hypothetical protein
MPSVWTPWTVFQPVIDQSAKHQDQSTDNEQREHSSLRKTFYIPWIKIGSTPQGGTKTRYIPFHA